MQICPLDLTFDVGDLQVALDENAHLWNKNTARTESVNSPHHGLDDIWVRFAAPGSDYAGPHESVWLGPEQLLPVQPICEEIVRRFNGSYLGGVLITRIPAGRVCKPHSDPGWHAREYEKVAVQIRGNLGQAFHFLGESYSALPGQCYWFDNSKVHWVTNFTDEDRITMIVCVKTNYFDGLKQ